MRQYEVLLCCPATHVIGEGQEAARPCTLILTPSAIHLLDHTSDLLHRSFDISRCSVEVKPSTSPSSLPKCSELWIQASSETAAGASVGIRGLHTVQGYLETLSQPPSPSQPTIELGTLAPRNVLLPPAPHDVLLLETHHCSQLMSLLWSLLKHHKCPDAVFLVHTLDL